MGRMLSLLPLAERLRWQKDKLMEFIDQGDYWEWVEVDYEVAHSGRDGESMDDYLTRYDMWLSKQEKELAEIAERNKKDSLLEDKEEAKDKTTHLTSVPKQQGNQTYGTPGYNGYNGYKHVPSHYNQSHHGHNGSHYPNYGGNYTYKEFRPFEGVDKKKWPSTWRMLFRFYFSSGYWKETKYLSDYEWRKHNGEVTETTQRMPRPYDGG